MFCPNCGTNNAEGATFCVNCGAPTNATPAQPVNYQSAPVQPAYGYQPQPAKDAGKGFAIASLVLGIISLFMFAYICGTLAIVFAVVAKKKGSTNKMATAGLVLGIVGVASWLLMQIMCASIYGTMGLL